MSILKEIRYGRVEKGCFKIYKRDKLIHTMCDNDYVHPSGLGGDYWIYNGC